jgi:hypothetical protein
MRMSRCSAPESNICGIDNGLVPVRCTLMHYTNPFSTTIVSALPLVNIQLFSQILPLLSRLCRWSIFIHLLIVILAIRFPNLYKSEWCRAPK